MVSVEEVRRRLMGSMMGLYAVLNSAAKKSHGRSFEELVVSDPDAARELLERVLGSRARVVAEILFRGVNGSFQGGTGAGVEGAGWVDPFPRGFYGLGRLRILA